MRKPRLGVDLDTHSQLKLLIVYFNARTVTPNVTVDATSKGFHVKLWGIPHNLDLRRWLSDDRSRIELDELRLHMGRTKLVDTLFDWKYKGKHLCYKAEPVNPLSMPFWLARITVKQGRKRNERKRTEDS